MLNLLLLTTAGFCAGYCFGAFLGTTKQKKEIIQLIKELEEDNAKMMNSFYLRDKVRGQGQSEPACRQTGQALFCRCPAVRRSGSLSVGYVSILTVV